MKTVRVGAWRERGIPNQNEGKHSDRPKTRLENMRISCPTIFKIQRPSREHNHVSSANTEQHISFDLLDRSSDEVACFGRYCQCLDDCLSILFGDDTNME